ncbi:putative pex19 protein [Septoria linicola]|nr:putative pex19 protein [Septoria linicola]
MADKQPVQAAAIAPDPEEDDLDDLDDVLDSFQNTKVSDPPKPAPASTTASTAAAPAPASSGPGRPPVISHDAGSEADFAAQLQAGMSGLIGELDSNPEMQAEFEKMMQELIAAGAAGTDAQAGEHLRKAAAAVSSPEQSKATPAAPTPAASSSKKAGGAASKQDNFQDSIRKTMERMQASDSTAKQSTSSKQNMSEDDLLAAMMRELTESGEGGEEGFNSMLMSMMAHLTNKEILYDPMKELHDKYPDYLEKNKDTISKEDLARYKEQQALVKEIVERFDRKGYSDDNEDDREYIVERMQKMQAAGSPPTDLVGDMSAAQEALGGLDEGCPTQ